MSGSQIRTVTHLNAEHIIKHLDHHCYHEDDSFTVSVHELLDDNSVYILCKDITELVNLGNAFITLAETLAEEDAELDEEYGDVVHLKLNFAAAYKNKTDES